MANLVSTEEVSGLNNRLASVVEKNLKIFHENEELKKKIEKLESITADEEELKKRAENYNRNQTESVSFFPFNSHTFGTDW